MPRRYAALFILLAVPLLFSGCYRARELESLCEDFAWQYPDADFERDVSFSLGSISLGAVKLAAGFADDTREAREYLNGLRRIDVAVFKVHHMGDLNKAELPGPLADLLDDDWEMAVKTREDDERVWILYREDDDVIRDLHITVLDDEELVMLRLSGELTETFQRVMEDHHGMISAIER